MKTFTELLKVERSTESLTRRRDAKNAEHHITKAQAEVQYVCAQQLARYCAYLEACSQLIAQGELHPLEHPLAGYYAELRRQELLNTKHPVTVQHPLTRA
jgi:hypothetical protein